MNNYDDDPVCQNIIANLYFDNKKSLSQRLLAANVNQELLIKAIGKGKYGHILDTTTGLGRDSFLMAVVSQQLVCLERNPILYQHLKHLFEVGQQNETLRPLLNKMTLINRCAIDFLNHYNGTPFDVIYCDPMFPIKSKSALPKKESQYLQKTVGTDEDAQALVCIAMRQAKHRIVVKRPINSPFLIQKPTLQYKARAHRFDVYCIS